MTFIIINSQTANRMANEKLEQLKVTREKARAEATEACEIARLAKEPDVYTILGFSFKMSKPFLAGFAEHRGFQHKVKRVERIDATIRRVNNILAMCDMAVEINLNSDDFALINVVK